MHSRKMFQGVGVGIHIQYESGSALCGNYTDNTPGAGSVTIRQPSTSSSSSQPLQAAYMASIHHRWQTLQQGGGASSTQTSISSYLIDWELPWRNMLAETWLVMAAGSIEGHFVREVLPIAGTCHCRSSSITGQYLAVLGI